MTVPTAAAPTRASVRYRGSRWWWVLAGLAILPAVVLPLSLLVQVLASGSDVAIPPGRLLELFANTMLLTVTVTVSAVAIGLATAWLTTRTDLRMRRTWATVTALPLVVPSYVAALSVIGATGPNGVLLDIPTPYGFVGSWAVLSLFTAPLVHLTVIPGLRAIDPATEDAATGLGSGPWRVFRTVTLPQLRPAIVSSALLVGLYTISDFGAVSLLRYDTFTRAIYTLYRGQLDRGPSATLSLMLMGVALLIVALERRYRKRAHLYSKRPRRARPPMRLGTGQRVGATMFLGGYALLSLGVPVVVMVASLARGLEAGQAVGDTLWVEAGRSIGISLIAGLVTAIAAFPVAMVTVGSPGTELEFAL